MCEQVLSWQVTSEMLAGWGFAVEETDTMMGTRIVLVEGISAGKALHAAWAAGFVRMAAMPEAVREAQLVAFREGLVEMNREANESLAFLRAHGSIVGPSHNN